MECIKRHVLRERLEKQLQGLRFTVRLQHLINHRRIKLTDSAQLCCLYQKFPQAADLTAINDGEFPYKITQGVW
jgi:hypothetical protein